MRRAPDSCPHVAPDSFRVPAVALGSGGLPAIGLLAAVDFYLAAKAAEGASPRTTQSTFRFAGDTQFSVATADWLALLRLLGYGVAPSLLGLAGDAMTLEASWGTAEQKLRDARRHLALGDDREALRTAYLLFDAMAANPFRSTWEAVLGDPALPAEKADVLRALLQAEASVLNKLGRHPAWELTDGADRLMLPLDHWEAELAIALAPLLLAAAFRWRSTKGAHELELPTALPQGAQPEA